MKTEDIEKVVQDIEKVATLIPTVGAIVSGVVVMIDAIDSVTQEDKDALIARIKKAQESIPVWE